MLKPGDKVMVQLDDDQREPGGPPKIWPRFSKTKAPQRAQWMTVRLVKRRPGQRAVEGVIVVDRNGGEWLIPANSMFMATKETV